MELEVRDVVYSITEIVILILWFISVYRRYPIFFTGILTVVFVIQSCVHHMQS